MSHSKKIASIAFTGAVATTATMMGVTPAHAASSFNVKANGVLYKGPIKGKLKAGTTAVLVDTTKNTTLTCKKATFSGIISKSKGWYSSIMGTVNAATWSSCTGPFGLTFKAHLTTKPRMHPGTGQPPIGVSGALVSKISGKISGTGLAGLCHATISGTSIPFKYLNAGHSFNINPGHVVTLHVKSVANCLGAVNTSDNAYFTANYTVSTPVGLTIS